MWNDWQQECPKSPCSCYCSAVRQGDCLRCYCLSCSIFGCKSMLALLLEITRRCQQEGVSAGASAAAAAQLLRQAAVTPCTTRKCKLGHERVREEPVAAANAGHCCCMQVMHTVNASQACVHHYSPPTSARAICRRVGYTMILSQKLTCSCI
jgi:hypothetical protein